ncbi:MAG TPA: DUF4340 domain-containing protein [Aliidongia sp.]|nr:DUF4340 domain-containing protein [Aliidongia sp.]
MRQKTLIALAAVTVPVLLAAIFVPAPGGNASKPAEAGPVFPTLKDWLGKATKLTITSADGTINLVRQPAPADAKPAADGVPATGWTLADKGGYPVQESVVRQLLAGMLKLRETEPKTERAKLYGRLDLTDPSADKAAKGHLIELADANGASIVKLIVGRRKYDPSGTGVDSIYVRKPDEARSWSAVPAFDVPSEATSWIDRKILDVEPDKIQSVTLTETGGKPLVLTREKAADKLDIKDLPKDAKLKGDNPGSELAAGFRFLDLLDVRPAAQVTAVAASTVELTTFDGLDVSIAIAEQDGAGWLKITAKGTGDAAKIADEIAKRTQGWAYKVPETREKTLETKLADLVQPPPAAPAPAPTAAATPPAKGRKGN